MKKLQSILQELKQVKWASGFVSLWLVYRKVHQRRASYTVRKVETEDKLRLKLRGVLKAKIDQSNQVLNYSFRSVDQDESLLGINSPGTGFELIERRIEELVSKGAEEDKATSPDDLLDAWAYVIRLEAGQNLVYGFRQVSRLWSTKKVHSLMNLVFEREMLLDLDDKRVFHIDRCIDFMSFRKVLFILDKKRFEAGLNFREGMEQNRDEALDEFADLGLFTDVTALRNWIGNNLHSLRRISEVRNNGYYRDPEFIRALLLLNEKRNWGLTHNNGCIVLAEQNFDLVLTLLNNDRLLSEINSEMFDVATKRLVK